MSLSARHLAAEVLIDVLLGESYSNLLLPKKLATSSLNERDRALVTELVYGTIRLKGRHDARISRVSDRSLTEIDPKVLVLLEMGVHQLRELRIPDHAAVSETVTVAKKICGQASASFVNAILRNILRSDDLDAHNVSHPDWILSSYQDCLRNENAVTELANANNAPAEPTLVAWPGKSTVAELVAVGAVALPDTHFAATYAGNPADIALVRNRQAGVQDYGSQLVTEIFAGTATKGRKLRWLDLCAGPGGKSSLLTAILAETENEFVANDISAPRAALVKQVISFGVVCSEDGRTFEHGSFDRILIDAPCSGIGALRRRPELRWRRTINDVKTLISLQSELLDSAVRQIAPDGIIAYVTCSPHLHETKRQVRDFLSRHKDFAVLPILPTAVGADMSDALLEDGTLQLWTHKHGTDAMFMAMFQRKQ